MSEINYFLILDLDFDPSIEDDELIAEIIEGKSIEWSLRAYDPDTPYFRQYLESLDDLKKRMSDPKERRKVAKDAKKLVDKPLVNMIRLFSRGGYTKFTPNTVLIRNIVTILSEI